jgi:hypothetical protein
MSEDALLTRVGFANVRVTTETHIFHNADLETYWQHARGTGGRRFIDALDPGQTERLRAALAERLHPYQRSDGYDVPATALLAVGDR